MSEDQELLHKVIHELVEEDEERSICPICKKIIKGDKNG